MSFDFGDVVLVPFPFSDQSGTKQRPALIVSSAAYNAAQPDVIIMAVTSRQSPESQGQFVILDRLAAGLLKPSFGKPVLTTIEQALVRKKLGRLAEPDRLSLRASLRDIIGAW
jgi:mRNA interferase MazF